MDLLNHWNRKHARAAYVPSLMKRDPLRYHYGSNIRLGEGTEFRLLLRAIEQGMVYLDPGIKLEQASSPQPKLKRRCQFRIKSADLDALYHSMSSESVL
jgi:hypothetical protein